MDAHPHVLVVDAEPLCRWALHETLADAGLHVTDADEDVDSVDIEDVDVLVLDAALPQGAAFRVLERVRERSPKCRVVVMTAFGDVELQRLPPLPTTGWRMIQKPFDVRRIVPLVIELAEADTRATGTPTE